MFRIKLIISFTALLLTIQFLSSQPIKDNAKDKLSGIKQQDFSVPRLDVSGFDDILKQIEPSSTSATIFNGQN